MGSEEIVTYLEMHHRDALCVPKGPAPEFALVAHPVPAPAWHRALYRAVGAPWQWTDRANWSRAQWAAHGQDPDVFVWSARSARHTVGFIELCRQAGGDVEIAYFGLRRRWIGRGLGGAVLAAGVDQAWRLPGARRVWLHTCNFDHPHALANYRARGFSVYRVEAVQAPGTTG